MAMKIRLSDLGTALRATAGLAVCVCLLYPAAVWLLDRALFPGQADGSLVRRDGIVVGSVLIGQPFFGPGYFHPRPSAAGAGYDASASGGSNLGPLSKRLAESVERRAAQYRAENGLPASTPVPADAVTASGSGLDPHISPANARLQTPRVARERGLPEKTVLGLIETCAAPRTFGLLGQPRVNVLELNLALDEAAHARR
jgi:potassium-transporting ATPase KdpC subunit